MEFIHTQKNIHHTPRKLRLVADMVRKMTPDIAIQTLQFTNKAAAIDLLKALKSAVANANNRPNLGIKHLEINEAMKLRRGRPAPRGRMRPYKLRMSHIKVTLTDEANVTAKIKSKADDVIEQLEKKGAE